MTMTPARRHRLKVLAEQQASANADDFGAYSSDATAYQLQLKELSNDNIVLKSIESTANKIQKKIELLPKHMPYIDGILQADQPVQDVIVTTMMVWCIDVGNFEKALEIGAFVLKHNIIMSDKFTRKPASILVEDIANAALDQLKADQDFDVSILQRVDELTHEIDMHDQIRAKLYHAMGKAYLRSEQGEQAVKYLKLALEKNTHTKAKQELKQAEKLAKEQFDATEQDPSSTLKNPDGTPVVDDFGSTVEQS